MDKRTAERLVWRHLSKHLDTAESHEVIRDYEAHSEADKARIDEAISKVNIACWNKGM